MREMVLRGPSQYDCLLIYENLVIDYLDEARDRWGELHSPAHERGRKSLETKMKRQANHPVTARSPGRTAVLLIAHGSRQQAANDDLHELAARIAAGGSHSDCRGLLSRARRARLADRWRPTALHGAQLVC